MSLIYWVYVAAHICLQCFDFEHRIRQQIKIDDMQFGFMKGKGTTEPLHMAQLMPLPLTVSCSSKIQIGFTFLVPAYPGSPGKEAVNWL